MIKNEKEIRKVKRETYNPYITDSYQCVSCGSPAKLQCPNCGNLKFCSKCAVKKAGKPSDFLYCPRCLYRLSLIPPRWVGTNRPMKKMFGDSKGMKRHDVAPKIYPKIDRQKMRNQKTERARKYGICIRCGSEEVSSYGSKEWKCRTCGKRFRKHK